MEYMKKNIKSSTKTQTPSFTKKRLDIIENTVSNNNKYKGHKTVFVGISGGPASGKTKISQYFHKFIRRSETICEMSFFNPNENSRNKNKDLEELTQDYDKYNKKRRLYLIDLCNPNSFDYDKFYQILQDLREGKKVQIPYFDEEKCEFIPEKEKTIDPSQTPLIIIDGYYIFKNEKIRDLLHLKIFKEVEEDVRLSRLILREENYLNKDKKAYEIYFKIYEKFIKASYMDNINGIKNLANIVLPDYNINENNQLEIDETLELILNDLTYLSKR